MDVKARHQLGEKRGTLIAMQEKHNAKTEGTRGGVENILVGIAMMRRAQPPPPLRPRVTTSGSTGL